MDKWENFVQKNIPITYDVYRFVKDKEEVSLSDVAAYRCITKQSAGALLKRLVENELIKRRTIITRKGREVLFYYG